jgi:hypothetical protein
MALTITETRITSDLADAYAEYRPHASADGHGAWVVYGSPWSSRLLDRNQAITAMTIAEEQARPEPNRLLIESLTGELQ